MIPSFNNAIQALLQVVRRANAAGEPLYLVGGAVRDLLCQREIKDLDFVTAGNTQQISWAVKRLLNARAFILDDERQTARVIHTLPNRQTILLDFVRFTGETLGEDLRARDFTINAMALDVNQPDQLIDPLGGQQDLQKGFLRVASEESMRLDPLRVMRGVRMALDYDLQLDPYTETLMKASGADLAKVSAERQRDELFKLLSLPQPQRAISRLHDLDALPALLPELCALKRVPVSAPHVHPLWQHTLQVVSYLDQLLDALLNPNSPAHLTAYFQDFLTAIAPYRPELVSHLQKAIQEERSRLSLLLFAALYHDAGKPEAMKLGLDRRLHFHGHADGSQEAVIYRACQLALSNNEVKYLACLTQHHMRIHHLASKALPHQNAPSTAISVIPGAAVWISVSSAWQTCWQPTKTPSPLPNGRQSSAWCCLSSKPGGHAKKKLSRRPNCWMGMTCRRFLTFSQVRSSPRSWKRLKKPRRMGRSAIKLVQSNLSANT